MATVMVKRCLVRIISRSLHPKSLKLGDTIYRQPQTLMVNTTRQVLTIGIDIDTCNASTSALLLHKDVEQRSQTSDPRAACGPQKGPMQPANIRKYEKYKRYIWPICLISQKTFSTT